MRNNTLNHTNFVVIVGDCNSRGAHMTDVSLLFLACQMLTFYMRGNVVLCFSNSFQDVVYLCSQWNIYSLVSTKWMSILFLCLSQILKFYTKFSLKILDLELPYTPPGGFCKVIFFWKPIQNATKWAMLALWRLGRFGFLG